MSKSGRGWWVRNRYAVHPVATSTLDRGLGVKNVRAQHPTEKGAYAMENRKGQALVELALVLPVLLIIVFGLIDFGRAMYTKNTLNNAARSGARIAVVTPSLVAEAGTLEAPSTTTATNIKNNLFNGIPATVAYSLKILDATGTAPVSGMAKTGNLVEVTVTWADYPMWTPLFKIGALISGSQLQEGNVLTLSGHAAMRYE